MAGWLAGPLNTHISKWFRMVVLHIHSIHIPYISLAATTLLQWQYMQSITVQVIRWEMVFFFFFYSASNICLISLFLPCQPFLKDYNPPNRKYKVFIPQQNFCNCFFFFHCGTDLVTNLNDSNNYFTHWPTLIIESKPVCKYLPKDPWARLSAPALQKTSSLVCGNRGNVIR